MKIFAKAATYVLTGIACGIICGGACLVFARLSSLCDTTFQENSRLLFLLPLSGLIVVLLYDYFRNGDDLSTDALFRYSHGESRKDLETNDYVSPWLSPLIALSTCLAYLTGGSCGRVGSALQCGGCLGVMLHRFYNRLTCRRIDGHDYRSMNPAHLHTSDDIACCQFPHPCRTNRNLFLACSMGAGFTAMLNAPVAGAVFGVEVLILTGSDLLIIIPSLISSFITWFMAGFFSIPYTDLHVPADSAFDMAYFEISGDSAFWKILIVAFAATLTGRLYAYGRTAVTKAFSILSNKIARVLVGTGLIIFITLLIGETCYNGIGFSYIREMLDGDGNMFAFAWKLLLTTITLGCGIRGGDISPSIFTGASVGFTLGALLGLNPGAAGAVCIVGTLGSVTKCPVAVFFLGLEMLCCSLNSAICFAFTSVIAHFLSGTYGIYHQQHSENQFLKPDIR